MPVKFAAEVSKIIRHAPDVATYRVPLPDAAAAVEAGPVPAPGPGRLRSLGALAGIAVLHHGQRLPGKGFRAADDRRQGPFHDAGFSRELEVGRKVWMKAPYGDFIVRTSREHDVVLIAGGTGVTPFVAFMEDALVKGLEGNVWLHYGARSQDLLVFRDFADRCARQFPSFRLDCYAETRRHGFDDRRPDRSGAGRRSFRQWQGGHLLFMRAAGDDQRLPRPFDGGVRRDRVECENRRLGVNLGNDYNEIAVSRQTYPIHKRGKTSWELVRGNLS